MRRPLLGFLVAALLPATAQAQVPPYLPVLGQLERIEDGRPVDGLVTLGFAIYDRPAGGDPLWEEGQSIVVDRGFFAAYLGDVTPLELTLFVDHPTLYLGVTVDDDSEMPRVQLASVPFAAAAQESHDALRLGGLGPGSFAKAAHAHDDAYYRQEDLYTRDELYAKADLYTKTEADERFAASGHDHDAEYYPRTELDALLKSYRVRQASKTATTAYEVAGTGFNNVTGALVSGSSLGIPAEITSGDVVVHGSAALECVLPSGTNHRGVTLRLAGGSVAGSAYTVHLLRPSSATGDFTGKAAWAATAAFAAASTSNYRIQAALESTGSSCSIVNATVVAEYVPAPP